MSAPPLPRSLRSRAGGRAVLGAMARAVLARWLRRRSGALQAQGCPPLATWSHDWVGQQVLLEGRYERELLDAVQQVLQSLRPGPGRLCVDAGANIGNHALFFATGHERVVAFEPHPRTFALLALNAQLDPRVQAVPLGLSDAPGEAWIDLPAGNAGMARVSAQAGQGRVACRLDTLDAQLAGCPLPLDLLKIDVEGHEAAVIRGGRERLRRDQPVVLLEQAAEAFRDGSTEALDELRALGYGVFLTFERWPAHGSRWLNLAARLWGGEGYRVRACRRLPHRFHDLIVAVPASLAAACPPEPDAG
jgi:FkbM family methyltransferase